MTAQLAINLISCLFPGLNMSIQMFFEGEKWRSKPEWLLRVWSIIYVVCSTNMIYYSKVLLTQQVTQLLSLKFTVLEILGLHLADVVNYQAQVMVTGFSLFGSLYSISLSFLNWLKWKRAAAYGIFKTRFDFLFLTSFFRTFLVP